jgi:RNA processing factor Prp31
MEPTTTLADALLDDLNDLMDSDEEQEIPHDNGGNENQDADGDAKMLAKEDALVTAESSALKNSFSRFLFNPALRTHLSHIETLDTNKTYARLPKKEREEEDHRLVVHSNRHLASLADELAKAHGELAMAYKPKFPELEELLPMKWI